ncbi:MAG: hypothetical protein BZ138_08250 [Methanosphaera sp. rholeuAM270]|nr:MAG: hypothetical protein BZ138_08250 [Methanosphaera sp. rholeuAM270]
MSSIKLKSKIEELYKVNDFVNNMIAQENMDINLIIEEIFANIISYSGCSYVIVNAMFDESTNILRLEFVDDGIKFNPLEKDDPAEPVSIEKVEIGGLGIFLTKNIADDMQYKYADNENHLIITKKVK